MRLSLLLPCVVVGGLIGASVFGQSGEEPAPSEGAFDETELEAAESLPAQSFDQSRSSTAEEVVQEEQELRRQYRQLMERKSSLMDRSALREAISRAEQDINELRAAEKLDEARVNLLELVKTHPETKAAATARAMLQARPQGPFVPTRDTPNGTYTAPSAPSGGQILSPGGAYKPSSSPIRQNKPPTADPSNAPFYQPNPKRKTIDS